MGRGTQAYYCSIRTQKIPPPPQTEPGLKSDFAPTVTNLPENAFPSPQYETAQPRGFSCGKVIQLFVLLFPRLRLMEISINSSIQVSAHVSLKDAQHFVSASAEDKLASLRRHIKLA